MNQATATRQFKQSLRDHVAEKGDEIQVKYGPRIGWAELQRILEDRTVVRYPCELCFSAEGLEDGEFAYPFPCGEDPEDGFTLRVHPHFLSKLDLVPHLALYQIVVINYGEFAAAEDAETFGAAALGLERDEYYTTLCALADQLQGGGCACGGGGSGSFGS